MTKKGLFAIFLIIALMFLIISANALPKLFPMIQSPGSKNQDIFGDYSDILKKPGPYLGYFKEKSNNRILITSAPSGHDWSDFDKGDSICTMPEGTVNAGDYITNCEGTITIVHIQSNMVTITGNFDTSSGSQGKEAQETEDDNNQNTEESEEFEIKITKPEEKNSYIKDINIKKGDNTIVVGEISVETEITNPKNLAVKKVDFSIDGEIKYTDFDGPSYSWSWDEKIFGKHTITVSAYDKNEELLDQDEITIRIFNFDIL